MRSLSGVCLVLSIGLVLTSLMLGFQLSSSSEAMAEAQRGQEIGVPAAAGGLAAIVSAIWARRRWAVMVLGLAVVLCAVALLLFFVG